MKNKLTITICILAIASLIFAAVATGIYTKKADRLNATYKAEMAVKDSIIQAQADSLKVMVIKSDTTEKKN